MNKAKEILYKHAKSNGCKSDLLRNPFLEQAVLNAINEALTIPAVVGQSEQLNYGFKKLDVVEWKGVKFKIVYIHEDTQQASIETLPDNKNYNIYKTSLRNITKVI